MPRAVSTGGNSLGSVEQPRRQIEEAAEQQRGAA
jgi:hypothetical protein